MATVTIIGSGMMGSALPSARPANYIWRNTLINVRRSATSREGAGNKTVLH